MKKILAVLSFAAFLVPSVSFAAFDTDLRYGSSGAPVLELQEFLTEQGVYSGPISGNFYSLTLAGVKALQVKLGVSPQSGFFGPLTRAAAEKILSNDLAESDTEASSTPVVNVPKHTTTNTSTQTTQTSSPAVGTSAPAQQTFSFTAQPIVDGNHISFQLDQKVDSAHVLLDDGTGKPQGFAYGSPLNLIDVGWNAATGTYSYTIDVEKKGQKGSMSGSLTVQ